VYENVFEVITDHASYKDRIKDQILMTLRGIKSNLRFRKSMMMSKIKTEMKTCGFNAVISEMFMYAK
jgi:hypothetical protein